MDGCTTFRGASIIIFVVVFGKISAEITLEVSRQNCTCVPYYQCSDESGEIITDGIGLLDLRILENSTCTGYFDVCCNVTESALSPTTENPTKVSGCGYQNLGFFPWYAALLYQEVAEFPASYKCGVSLIHPKVTLTAAHCLRRDNGILFVRVGNMQRKIEKTIIHPKYNKKTLQNDIALAILQDPVELSEKVNTICIPPEGTSLENTECSATVRVKNQDGSYLRMLNLSILPKEKCLKMLRSTRLGPFFQLHHSFLCAGGNKKIKDTCGGDGGSPLVCPVPGQPGRFHQAGIVSWGIGCGENNIPDVYIKLPSFRNWIDEEMKKNGFDITFYRY